MKNKEAITRTKQILDVYIRNRAAGHSLATMYGAYDSRTPTLLTHNEAMCRLLKDELKTMHTADGVEPNLNIAAVSDSVLAHLTGPVLLDNALIAELFASALARISELENRLKNINKLSDVGS